MKLSIVSGLKESQNSKEEVIKKFTSLCELLKPLNYDGIEFSLLEPEIIDIKGIVEVKESYDMEISALGTGSTFIRFGYSFGHQVGQIREKAIRRIENYISFAKETDSKVIIGLIRGRYNYDNNPGREKINIVSSMKECCLLAEDNDVELVFEPINSFEIDSYNTISDSIGLIDEINSKNLTLLLDSYHTNLEEDPTTIWDYLKEIAPKVGHIHLADSTRRAPGSGNFDFKSFLSIFKDIGYKDYASIETIMKPSFEDVARNTSEHLKSML